MTFLAPMFFLAAMLLTGPAAYAQTQLNPEQMSAARKVVSDGKSQAAKDLTCPAVVIPFKSVQSQKDFDGLKDIFESARTCVQEIEDVSTERSLERMVALRFPQASDSQKKELVALFQEALEPIRMKALTVLQKTTQDVLNAGRPFVLRRLLEDTVQNNAFVCIEPYIPSLLNLKEAPMYLDLYKKFDACIETLRDETLAWNEKTFVQEHFGQETATVQQHLAAQLPTIKTALAEKLQRRLDNARNSGPRAKAQAYVESNGKGRMPEE